MLIRRRCRRHITPFSRRRRCLAPLMPPRTLLNYAATLAPLPDADYCASVISSVLICQRHAAADAADATLSPRVFIASCRFADESLRRHISF